MRRLILFLLAAGPCAAQPAAQSMAVLEMLDRYAAGRFPEVVEELRARSTFDDVLEGLRHDGERWIEAGGRGQRKRRTLVAASVALEAARAGAWTDWKFIQRQGDGTASLASSTSPTT